MEHSVRVRYTEQMLRQAVRLYMWHGVLRPRWWLWLCAVLLLFISFAGSWPADAPVIRGLSIAAFCALIVVLAAIWRAQFAHTVGTFRSLTSPDAEMVFHDTDLTVTSTRGSFTFPWQNFVKLCESRHFWMLFLAPNQFITLPLDTLPAETLRFVRSKLP
jgi:hypothetical protein